MWDVASVCDNAKAAAVAVLVGKSDDKITMAVTVTKDAQAKGLKAGNLIIFPAKFSDELQQLPQDKGCLLYTSRCV